MIRRMLRKERTDYGKNLRKSYESGEVWESRHKMTSYAIRPDDISNTLSTVLKDNLLVEIHGQYEEETEGERNLTKTNEVFNGKPFTYVSLFSGIGGFETALNKLGGTCVLASEIDRFANQSYEALYGHATAGDITKIDAADVPDHDVLVGGFPCQAFSVAGKRGGFDDARGTLFFEVARLAKTKQPRMLLLENVKGLVGHDGGKTLDTIVQTLNDIGYHVDFNVLNSKYFGVPQNRERIFIVALRDDIAKPADWTIEGTNVVAKGKRRIAAYDGVKTFNFEWPGQTEVTTRLRDVLETEVDEKYYLSDEKTAKLVAQLETSERQVGESSVDGFHMTQDEQAYCISTRIAAETSPKHIRDRQGCLVKVNQDVSEPRIIILGNTSETTQHGNFNVFDEEGLSRTVAARDYKDPVKVFIRADYPRYRIRKLTPLECWRLQGFTDAQHQTVVNAGISDSQRYKTAGNAVTVNVIEAIGKRLLTLLKGSRAKLNAV